MGREFELKYEATPEILHQIHAEYRQFSTISMETTYYDTENGDFAVRKMTLRLRKENDTVICTLKTPHADGGRGEWECEATDIHEGLAQLLCAGAPSDAALPTGCHLQRVCGARFTRLAAQILVPDGTAELALDQGVLLGGGKEIPLCEVEVEQKTCSEASAIAFAAALASKYGLQPETKSKFRRALALAQGD